MNMICKCYKHVLIPLNSSRTLPKSNCVPSLSPISINICHLIRYSTRTHSAKPVRNLTPATVQNETKV